MPDAQPKDPLHGVTLETILNRLVDEYGWEGLAKRVAINCFKNDPSGSSSLKFLRKTPWACKEVEDLFVSSKPWRRDWVPGVRTRPKEATKARLVPRRAFVRQIAWSKEGFSRARGTRRCAPSPGARTSPRRSCCGCASRGRRRSWSRRSSRCPTPCGEAPHGCRCDPDA